MTTLISMIVLLVGFVQPNCMFMCLSMFEKTRGSASAAMGTGIVLGGSLVTACLGLFSLKSLSLLFVFYLSLATVALAARFLARLAILPRRS